MTDEYPYEFSLQSLVDNTTDEKKTIAALQKENLDLNKRLNEAYAELNKARLTLAKIYEIVDHEYDRKNDYCIGEICGDDLKEIAGIIKEYGV